MPRRTVDSLLTRSALAALAFAAAAAAGVACGGGDEGAAATGDPAGSAAAPPGSSAPGPGAPAPSTAPTPSVAPAPSATPVADASPAVDAAADASLAADASPARDSGADSATADAGPPPVLRFAALGDTGKGNTGQRNVGNALAAKCRADGCDFVQLLGDNFYDSGVSSPTDPLFVSHFEVPYAGVSAPFWVVLGNHDYGAGGAGTDFTRGKHQVDYTARSTKWKLPSNYWHRTAAHAELIGLDTNLVMFGLASDQARDVPRWIAAATSTWKIAFGHHPYRSNGPHGNAGSYDNLPFVPIANGKGVKDFLEDHVCGRVDVYISGHDHSSQWLTPKCGANTELLVAGAGASATTLASRNASYFQTETLSFLYVVIEGRKLTASFISESGATLFTRSYTK